MPDFGSQMGRRLYERTLRELSSTDQPWWWPIDEPYPPPPLTRRERFGLMHLRVRFWGWWDYGVPARLRCAIAERLDGGHHAR